MHSARHAEKNNEEKTGQTEAQLQPVDRLFSLPADIWGEVLSPFLTGEDVVACSLTSRNAALTLQYPEYWENAFLREGCEEKLLNHLRSVPVSLKYRKLYRAWVHIPLVKRIKIYELWELCSLSGELEAINYMVHSPHFVPSTRNRWGATFLHYAAWSGNPAAVERTLTILGIDPLEVDFEGRTVLHYAAWSGNRAAIELTLRIPGIDPLKVDLEGRTILDYAAWSGNLAAVERIFRIKRVMQSISRHPFPYGKVFCYIALSGNLTAIERLLAISPINFSSAVDFGSRTMLHYAALSGNLAAVERVLAIPGIDPLAADREGRTVLHYAASSGNPVVIERLLGTPSINPLVADYSGLTVLHYAALSGNPAAVEYTLSLAIPGLNPLGADSYGRTILHYAAWGGNPAAIESILTILRTEGIQPAQRDIFNRTVLHYAALSGDPLAINRVLAIEGITIEERDNNNRTALHYAGLSLNPRAVDYMVPKAPTLSRNTNDRFMRDADWYALHCNPYTAISAFRRRRRQERNKEMCRGLAWVASMITAELVAGLLYSFSLNFLVVCLPIVSYLLIMFSVDVCKNWHYYRRYGFFEGRRVRERELEENEIAISHYTSSTFRLLLPPLTR